MENLDILNDQPQQERTPSTGNIVLQVVGVILRLMGFVIVGSVIAFTLVGWFSGVDMTKMAEKGVLANDKNFILLLQGTTQLFSFIILPLIYAFFFNKNLLSKFHNSAPKFGQFALLSILIMLFCIPIVNWMVDWNSSIELPSFLNEIEKWMQAKEAEAKRLTEIIAYYNGTAEFIYGLIIIALIPAIGEELLFRGIIQNELVQITKNPHLAIWISGFIFSFLHFQFYGFFPRMLLGVTFGYLYYWSGTLFIPMLVHFINNGLTFILLNLYKQKAIDINPESSESIPFYSILISIVIFIFLLLSFKKLSIKEEQ